MDRWKRLPSGIQGWIIAIGIAAWLLAACSAPSVESSTQVAAEDALHVEPTSTATPPYFPTSTVSTPIPTAAPLIIANTPDVTPTATDFPTDTPPKPGSFDVYLTGLDSRGEQVVKWIDSETGEAVTEATIHADDAMAIRAGQYVYYYAASTRIPMRMNTSGTAKPVDFAKPPQEAAAYEFLPSATGKYLAWVIVQGDGSYTIFSADVDGSDVQQIASDTLAAGEQIHLIRVTNDGREVFYERRIATISNTTLFRGRYSLYAVDTVSDRVVELPGEPACGEVLVCDAHISPDGAFLIRTLSPTRYRQPIVVTNLVMGVVLHQFSPPDESTIFAVDLGFPFLTPGGEIIYEEAYGPVGLESYRLIWANIVTGEQRVIAELGSDKHRPLGWAADGKSLLTTREPNAYDTWQINIETGAMQQIAGMLFLGHIEEPAIAP